MKKLMIAMVAVALATVANAALTYEYYVSGSVARNSHEETGTHAGYYRCFAMSQADARKALGATETVTYMDVANWLGKYYAHGQSATAISTIANNAAELRSEGWLSEYRLYGFYNDKSGATADREHIGVFFYDDGTTKEYLVMAQASKEDFVKFDATTCKPPSPSSGWAAPEPTSGILILLGVAGLALKRKQK